jgi:hypothetical protein
MNESNKNFDELKQLLKLKRHEIPPPGYFNSFSDNVVSRIRAGEAGEAQHFMGQLQERLHDQLPWLMNKLRILEAKPGLIGGFAVSLCLVLVVGVVLADRSEPASADAGAMASMQATTDPGSATTLAAVAPSVVAAADNSGISVSTNPVMSLQPVAALFGQQQNPLFQSASFMTPSR